MNKTFLYIYIVIYQKLYDNPNIYLYICNIYRDI